MQQATAIGRQAQKLDLAAQLAAGMAHEINTPVQYIGDNLRFLKDAFAELIAMLRATKLRPEMLKELSQEGQKFDFGYLEGEIPQAIEQALEGVSRVTKLVSAIQEFSHPGADVKLAINLNHAIESTMLVARNEWKYVAEMKLDLDPALPLVWCHPGEINQVVYSLMVQVAHGMGDRAREGSGLGLITVQTRRVRGWAELRIEDSGTAGAEPRTVDPSFTWESFHQGGPGLAIARAVVEERHQGTLDFETEEIPGGRFTLRLPCLLPV